MHARRTAAVAVAVLAAVALTGCGAGMTAQTQRQHNTTTGLNIDLQGGNLQIRDVYATPAGVDVSEILAGSDLALHFHIFNRTGDAEALVGLSSESAQSVTLTVPGSTTAGQLVIPPRNGVTVGGAPTGPVAVMRALTKPRFVGTYVQLTMTFGNAGAVKMTVPIEDPQPTATT